jgi:hypothetical protein
MNLSGSTDRNRNLVGELEYFTYQKGDGTTWSVWTDFEWKPATNISLAISPGYEHNIEAAQYVGALVDPFATGTYGSRYLFAQLDQTTVSAGIRVNWTFTPKLSLQLYLQPLISTGDYELYKELAQSNTFDFNVYGETNSTITRNGEEYTIDPDASGPAQPFVIGNPDFNYVSLRGNAVLRWEYLPGSVLYFVWTQEREDIEPNGEFTLGPSLNRLTTADPDNIFMVKLTYWWSN